MKFKFCANSLFLVFSFVATANASPVTPQIPKKIDSIYEKQESVITLPFSIQFSTISGRDIKPTDDYRNYDYGEHLEFKIPGLTSKNIIKATQTRTYSLPSEICANLPVKNFKLHRYEPDINSYWGEIDRTYIATASGTKTCLKIVVTRDFTTYLRDMQGSFLSAVTYPWEAVVTYKNGKKLTLRFVATY